MRDELLSGVGILALAQSGKLFLAHVSDKAPLGSQLSLPLASNPLVLREVVRLSIRELLPVIPEGLASR